MSGSARRGRQGIAIGIVAVTAGLLAACGGDGEVDSVDAAQAKVTSAERAVDDAKGELSDASEAFCKDGTQYLEAIDRYGKIFHDDATTVGDVTTAATDLERPADEVASSADDVKKAQAGLADAEKELADARNALLVAQSSTTVESTTTTTTPAVAPASVEQVTSAQEDLTGVSEQIGADTPLVQASAQLNSAAVALEVASLRVFADAGCLTDEQQAKAVEAVADYTAALQTSLHTAGYYDGPIDGIYGSSTVDAVEKLQTDNKLPTTGYVDQATALALADAVGAVNGATAADAIAHTAAVQSMLTLAGYWTGPVDGKWTPELTDAVKELQTDLGVETTGAIDAATIDAAKQAIEDAKTAATTTTSTTAAESPDGGSTSTSTDY